MTLVELVDVTLGFPGAVVLEDVALTLPAGALVAVHGASGSGKSTLLDGLAGLRRPHQGHIAVDGEEPPDAAAAQRQGVVLMSQESGLAHTLTAIENLMLPLVVAGTARAEARRRALSGLTEVGLEDWADHLVEELSGGQRQRVAVAQVLGRDARVVLLDEPTSALDGGNRDRVMALLQARAAAGVLVVMATNDPEAADAADGVIVLDDGAVRWSRPVTPPGGAHRMVDPPPG